jgi:hypothetical protein
MAQKLYFEKIKTKIEYSLRYFILLTSLEKKFMKITKKLIQNL